MTATRAVSVYIESREKPKVRPEVMAHFRASVERNRRPLRAAGTVRQG